MPVYSPLPLSAVLSGFRGLLSSSYAARAREEVEAWLKRGDPQREVLLLDSGTSALTLALKATATDAKRPVAIPAFACYDIATAVDGAGVPFVFYDIDPATLGPDLESLRAALVAGADRIVVVHLYGIPVDLDAVAGLAAKFGATLIEDAAQGVGGSWRGTPLGFSGSLGVFSFGRGKGVTGGGGGALVGNDASGREVVRSRRTSIAGTATPLRDVVATVVQWALARRALYWIPASLPFLRLGETRYRSAAAIDGMSAYAASVLRKTVTPALEESIARRRNAKRIDGRVRSGRPVGPDASAPCEAAYLRLPLLREAEHDGKVSQGMRRVGVMPGYPSALPDLPGFGGRQIATGSDPQGARVLAKRLVTLPVHGKLSERDIDTIVDWTNRS